MMQLTHPKVAKLKPEAFGLKSAIEHWPSVMDTRQSIEKPLCEAAAGQAVYLPEKNIVILEVLPYSPDPDQSAFFLFPKLEVDN